MPDGFGQRTPAQKTHTTCEVAITSPQTIRFAAAGRVLSVAFASIPTLVAVSLLPTFIAVEPETRIFLSTSGFEASLAAFVDDMRTGNVNRFYMGRTPRYLTEELARYTKNSAAFILPAVLIATAYAFGIPPARRVVAPRAPAPIGWLAMVPAFVVAMVLQTLALQINRATGIHVFTLAYLGGVGMPVFLPATTLALPVVAYSIKTAENAAHEIAATDYIRAAVGRAVPPGSLWFRHVGCGVLTRLDDAAPRVAATAIGTLFIAERIFNLPGLTVMLIEFPFDRGYQRYPPEVAEVAGVSGAWITSVQVEVVLFSAVALVLLYLAAIVVATSFTAAVRRLLR